MIGRALVTGATGFLGSRLAARLAATGTQVVALARATSDVSALESLGERVRVLRHPGSTRALVDAVGEGLDAVFHTAGHGVLDHRPEDVGPLVLSNVLFTAEVLEAASAGGARCFLNTGSWWQHAGGPAYSPNSLYAATKQAAADLVTFFATVRGLPAVTLVMFDVYGPGDPRPKLLSQLRQCLRTGAALDLSPGAQRLRLVHVDDACAAYLHAAVAVLDGELPARGESWSVAGPESPTLREVVALYARAAGAEPPVRWGGRPYRRGEVMEPWVGPALPGWEAKIGLEEGLRGVAAEAG